VKQYEDIVNTDTNPITGGVETWTVQLPLEFRAGKARHGAGGSRDSHEKVERCWICDSVYGASEGLKRNGHFYCFKNGCSKDLAPNKFGVVK
jgi:hypothetical protein